MPSSKDVNRRIQICIHLHPTTQTQKFFTMTVILVLVTARTTRLRRVGGRNIYNTDAVFFTMLRYPFLNVPIRPVVVGVTPSLTRLHSIKILHYYQLDSGKIYLIFDLFVNDLVEAGHLSRLPF